MQRFFFILIFTYLLPSSICFKYTIKELQKLFSYKIRYQNQIDFFNTLRKVSFIPILNLIYFVLIIEDLITSRK
jgi:hypothetical protein